ncbi:MAG TPA: UDP-N-acetylglucosamine 2-epimerase (non-hydrolyzing) [Candidatus Edwardsbacteria bacterium]|nr:UDP-N-acetylglucosamine 2-epimerase (non-hydrolyzing) [Candidatus Edwardsbacteria bacterium]
MNILTVIGARPQFIKAAPLCRALRRHHREVLVHTGQHYDHAMSAQFFSEMGIPEPDHNLNVGSGSHAAQTGAMLVKLEAVLVKERPDAVVIFGDTNSTLAGSLAAAKLGIPIAHIEAGMRSFNRAMPEEINRVLSDHIASYHFCSTAVAVANLKREGIRTGIFMVGDIMADALRLLLPPPRAVAKVLGRRGVEPRGYVFATIHRAENTDHQRNLAAIAGAMAECGWPVIFPVHPRTVARLKQYGLYDRLAKRGQVRLVSPVGYGESLALQSQARAVLTDSGGLQKEAYLLRTPCVTARAETEWVETVRAGWNTVVGPDAGRIIRALATARRPARHPLLYGDGHAAERIVRGLERSVGR